MIFGSFLNVVIYRVPNGLSIVSPPSSCPKCGHKINWYENIPVLSWIFLRAKCSSCGLPISIEYPAVELASGLITMGLFVFFGPTLHLIIYIPLSYALLCIALVDYKTYSIPYGLNLTLFAIAASGVVLNIFTGSVFGLTLLGSVFGGITGFAILYLLQLTGKLIYKQDAVGTGDLYLLGSAGLILGPKLVFIAFILGSIVAVASFAVPSFFNLIKRKQQSLIFKNAAEKYEKTCVCPLDEKLDLLGLKMQISYNFKDGQYPIYEKEITLSADKAKISNLTLLRLFFRFSAVKDDFYASDLLKKIYLEEPSLFMDIKSVIFEDLIGYDSAKDNLDFLSDAAVKNALNGLKLFIAKNKKELLSDEYSEKISGVEDKLRSLTSTEEKFSFLMRQNRFYQFNGYIAEQKRIVELIESLIGSGSPELMQRYLSEITFVYFKDFFFDDSRKSFKRLNELIENKQADPATVKSIYNIALFRIYFYKQRLAFGPFLAAGIMLSLLWGSLIAQKYFEFLQGVFF
jgi:leader peptidase (prepilin peptidase) / N-methyltransferase